MTETSPINVWALTLTIVAVLGIVLGSLGLMLWLAHRKEEGEEDE